MKPGKNEMLYYARLLETMGNEGYCPISEIMTDAHFDAQQESALAWIASNPDDPSLPELAADWLKGEMIAGRHDPAGRLSRAISSGKVRESPKKHDVFWAIAQFIRKELRWPSRDEIQVEGVSERTRDLAFEDVEEKLLKRVDGRERWTDPQ